jgi:hypothetical protein
MLITKKDRSFILLIISFILIIYSISPLASLIKSSYHHQNHKILIQEKYWINVNEKPEKRNLKSRLILLSFFTDQNLIERLLDSENLKNKFGRNLSIIAIYKGKKSEEDIERLSERFNLNFPIIFDKDQSIFQYFKSKNEQFTLLELNGDIHKIYQITDFNQLNQDISKLVKISKNLKEENFKIPYQQILPSYILSKPTFLDYIKKIKIDNFDNSAVAISNSGYNNIIISSLDGRIINKIGSRIRGYQDGNFQNVKFNYPQGFVIDKDIIYVADSGNHAIRKINLTKQEVSTIIGSGKKKGSYLKGTIAARKANLWFPTDLELSKDRKNLIIANYGAGQILSYNFENKTLSSLTKIDDNNKLAIKPKTIQKYQNKLYFLDEDIIKYLDKNNQIYSLKIADDIIESDSFYIEGDILFSANSQKQLIQKIDLKQKEISEIKIAHNKSSDLLNINNFIYLVESDNDKIIKINKKNTNIKIFDILPKLEVTEDKVIKYLPNFNFTDEIFIKSDSEVEVEMKLKKSWKINQEAPSFINLVEIDENKKAKLIQIYNWQDIKKNKIKLPKLKKDFTYYIKAIIYYCRDLKNSICMVNEYHKKINVSHNISNKKIKIEFLYPNNE